jgi:hypothetical protein
MIRLVLLLLFLVTACGDQRSFDQRYEDTAAAIQQRAAEHDAKMNAADVSHTNENSASEANGTGK